MRKLMVFKHVPQENLGSFRDILAEEGFRVRYVNFAREPGAEPSLDRYRALVVLGGWMGVNERERFPHLKLECRLMEQALKKGIPVLGICLGAQLLAHTLGGSVRKNREPEAGWQEIALTEAGRADTLLGHFGPGEKVFQMHEDSFSIPASASHLAFSPLCEGQAFRYGESAYGLQFHLEADESMVSRFLKDPSCVETLRRLGGKPENLQQDSAAFLQRSLALSRQTFSAFLRLLRVRQRPALTRSLHGKSGK